MKKALCIIAAVLAVLVLAAVIFVVSEHRRGVRELAATEKALKERGEKLGVRELAPPLPPAEQNGMPALIAASHRLRTLDRLPPSRPPAPGTQVLIVRLNSWPRYDMTNVWTWADLEESVAAHEEAFAEIKSALAKPSFNTDLAYERGSHLLLPHLAKLKSASQHASARVLCELHEHQRQDVLADLETLGRLAEVLRDEPLLISQLFRVALAHITLNAAWQALHSERWSGAELERLQRALPAPDFAQDMIRALEMERAMARITLRKLIQDPKGFQQLWNPLSFGLVSAPPDPASVDDMSSGVQFAKDSLEWFGDQTEGAVASHITGPLWKYAWFDQAEAHYLNSMQHPIAFGRIAAKEHSYRAYDADWGDAMIESATWYDKMRFVFTYLIMPAMDKAVLSAMKVETYAAMTATAVALERHRVELGQYPARLEDLTPRFLPAVPIDRMDGQPLRYRRDADGFLLYSVGEDFADDGGDPMPKNSASPRVDFWSGRDVVWPRPATAAEIEAAEMKARKSRIQ